MNSVARPVEALGNNDYRVLLLPLTRRDGNTTSAIVERAQLTCRVCEDSNALAAQIGNGVGAILMTDVGAMESGAAPVVEALSQQPPWSDVPVILLSRADRQSPATTKLLASLTNVTVLDRPTSARTLVSALHAAIRGRRRQYEIRDQLGALRAAEDALRSADRRKDEFLAMLAHELRNPLAPIRAASELLARKLPFDPSTRTAVEIVKRQAVHLSRLVDDLLDVSRITQGRIQLQCEPLKVSAIVSQAVESVEPLVRQKRHKLSVASNYEPLYVRGDCARLVQCVTNLLTNAAKYTDPGGAILIDVRSEGTTAVIAVTDNGVGIGDELLPRVFELFVQSQRSLDRAEGGLGVGLSVVQRLIEMHEGSITASSDGHGHGSTFEIRLPLIAPESEATSQRENPLRSPKRVLVVDDNVDAAFSVSEVLRLDGHVVEYVHSAGAALQSADAFAPDVILLDIGLPDTNGYEVAKRIRASGNLARLIALTGYGQPEDVKRAESAGFTGHLVKPVDLAALERAIAGSDKAE